MENALKEEINNTEDNNEKDNNENELLNENNEENEGENMIVKKQRKKRRTKDEIDGRDHICSICQKAYLSNPALTNHQKSKHPNLEFHPPIALENNKKRGRPKKNLFANFIADYDLKIKNLFDYEPRKNTPDNTTELVNSINNFFTNHSDIKKELENSKFFHELTINKSDLENKLESELETNKESKENSSIDSAFSEFIKFTHNKINDEYFLFLLKFIFLLRKFIILSCESKNETSAAFSDLIPDYSNDFFVYMNDNNFFDVNSDENRLEMVSLMQYLCNWLLENRYTKSRLILLNK